MLSTLDKHLTLLKMLWRMKTFRNISKLYGTFVVTTAVIIYSPLYINVLQNCIEIQPKETIEARVVHQSNNEFIERIHGTVSYVTYRFQFKPFTPESNQCQIYPAASPEILHHTVRRTWLFIAYSDER